MFAFDRQTRETHGETSRTLKGDRRPAQVVVPRPVDGQPCRRRESRLDPYFELVLARSMKDWRE